MLRRRTAFAVVFGIVVGLVSAVPATTAALADSTDFTTPADYAAASAQAVASGTAVEVTGRRTETSEVFANPDGTFSTESAPRPVRVHRADGSWADVDTTLHANADGTLTPAAVPMDLRLNPGGSGPLVWMGHDGDTIGLTWPGGSLPAPRLSGDTAVYSEVMPGVDLQVKATVDGFTDVVVVKSASAAASVRQIQFGLSTGGVTATVDGDGALSATDVGGNLVFTAPPAKMWDSTAVADPTVPVPDQHLGAPTESSTAEPGAGAHQASIPVTLSGGTLGVLTDAEVLEGGRYPVYVDPETTFNLASWTEVNAYAPNSVWRTPDNRPAVGHAYDDFGTYTVRSYYGFNVAPVRGAHIYSAFLRTYLLHSWSCRPTPIELWAMNGGFNTRATWNTQPSWAGAQHQDTLTVAKGYSGCAPGQISFNATKGVARAAAARASTLSFGLKATNENDVFGWKKFDIASRTTMPQLDVTYDFAPNAPTARDLSTQLPNTSCTSSTTNAPHVHVPTTGMTLRVRVTDPDGTQNKLRANVEWWVSGGSKISGTPITPANPGAVVSTTLPGSAVGTDRAYAWRVSVTDINPDTGQPMLTSAWSPWCVFVQDSHAPNAPAVTSPQYPPDADPAPGTGVGRSATFTLDANGSTDVTRYVYALNSPIDSTGGGGTSVAVAAGASTTVAVTPNQPMLNKLFVMSFDSAGNHQGQAEEYDFDVDGGIAGPVARFPFDADTADTSGNGNTVGAAGVTLGAGQVGNAGHFDGTTSFLTTQPAVDAVHNFAVNTWARLAATGTSRTAVSLNGRPSGSGDMMTAFSLGYDAASGKWSAQFTGGTAVLSGVAATAGTWTLLTTTWDAGSHQLRLFVNGQLAGTGTGTPAANFAPGFAIGLGGGQVSGVVVSRWSGDLDQVQVWDRMAYPNEVAQLGHWALDGDYTDSSDFHRNVTPATGATLGTDRFGLDKSALVSTGGSQQFAAAAGPVLRTDSSYTVSAWVEISDSSTTTAAVCQLGNRACPFYLEYRQTPIVAWSVTATTADSDTPGTVRAATNASPPLNTWFHLVVVYDAVAHKLRLYAGADGSTPVLAQEVAFSAAWNATGAFNIGRSKWQGAANGFWRGGIDDVSVYGDALNTYEVTHDV